MKHTSLLSLTAIALLTACGVLTDLHQQTASQIATPAFMVERNIPAGMFQLNAWERMHTRHDVATVYIEGATMDVSAVNQKINSIDIRNPTPSNPVALHLASRDQSKNVAYIARPCQFIKGAQQKGCDSKYWQEQRFAPEVIEAYETALTDIAARYNITGFHLVGYDGGANIAAVLAARNKNVLSLRSVAGELNPEFVIAHNKDIPLAGNAMLATDYGLELSKVPQHHFIGGADDVIIPGVYHSYRQAVGHSSCIHYSLVQDADHKRGWVEKWPELLKLSPKCAEFEELPPMPPAGEIPDVGYKSVMKGLRK